MQKNHDWTGDPGGDSHGETMGLFFDEPEPGLLERVHLTPAPQPDEEKDNELLLKE